MLPREYNKRLKRVKSNEDLYWLRINLKEEINNLNLTSTCYQDNAWRKQLKLATGQFNAIDKAIQNLEIGQKK